MNQHHGSTTLPRGFRYAAPKTPEPFQGPEETQIPSPPRPRLRLKRRNVSHHLSAPTQQFLASVAAADIPIPSIEEPATAIADADMDFGGIHVEAAREDTDMLLLAAPRGRTFSPPKTPAPGSVPSLSPPRYPNWTIDSAISSSIESTPDYESSRPSTSRSTQTSTSLFSRFSHLSDDDHCASPEVEGDEPFTFLDGELLGSGQETIRARSDPRKAPWTKAMSTHLWSTFILYLQDPKVTPFRMGKSCLPPHGVCLRVAREARRTWKGSKVLEKAVNPADGKKSGSSTPTAESSVAYIQWPHTCAATRTHLRELCKLKASSTSGARNFPFVSRSPTPFTQAASRHWNRRSTPARSPSVFATDDIAMSLALSTADSMQPTGPLAQLTSSTPAAETAEEKPVPPPTTEAPGILLARFEGEPSFAERRRLGSPFSAKSYGPSSSSSLAAALGLNSPLPHRQTHTVGPRRTLQSPVRLSRSGTQKRRNTQSCVPRKRPSLASDIWLDPKAAQTEATGPNLISQTRVSDSFVLGPPAIHSLASSASMPDVGLQSGAFLAPPPRLGSPFSGSSSSFSFPRRMHRNQPGSVDLGMLGRPFATVQETTEGNAIPARTNLTDRLAYIDQRLKEFRSRDTRTRSGSPF
jgi:hypothetical protein